MTADTSYEDIPYENYAFPGTHPNRLAGLLRLAGGTAAAPATARVLELGCAAGANLLPMGVELPRARFVGVDLSAGQVAAGEALRRQAGIDNVELRCANVMDIDAAWGRFDYILMHGLYSYVPPIVQDKLLAICRDHLAPGGGAYIGFNVLPGWHFNAGVREMLIDHVAGEPVIARRPTRAREYLAFLAAHAPQDARGQQIRELAKRLESRPDAYLYHEYLESENRPIRFGEFMKKAQAHGMRYVGESALSPLGIERLPPPMRDAIVGMAGDDPLRREQLIDDLTGRTLRCALLTTADSAARPTPRAECLDLLHLATIVRLDGPPVATMDAIDQPLVLSDGRKIKLTTPSTMYRAAFGLLIAASPQAIGFDDLLGRARALSQSKASVDDDRRTLRANLLEAFHHGIVEPLAEPWTCGEAGERPAASALARAQATAGHGITTLHHKQLFPPPKVREMIPLMDGSRSVAQLVDAVLPGMPAAPGMDAQAHRAGVGRDFANVLAYLRGHGLFAG